MSKPDLKQAIIDYYLDLKGGVGNPGYEAAGRAWDRIRQSPTEHLTIWAMAVEAETADRAAWGCFRALVEAWLLDETGGSFPPGS